MEFTVNFLFWTHVDVYASTAHLEFTNLRNKKSTDSDSTRLDREERGYRSTISLMKNQNRSTSDTICPGCMFWVTLMQPGEQSPNCKAGVTFSSGFPRYHEPTFSPVRVQR
jgi:hypothetical protein